MDLEREFAQFTEVEKTPDFIRVARRIALSTGRILTPEGEGHGTFLILPENQILTALHCFEGRDEQNKLIHGTYLPRSIQLPNGQIIEISPDTIKASIKPELAELDIVVVQLQNPLSCQAFNLKPPTSPKSFAEGRKVALLGYPNDVLAHFNSQGPFVSLGFVYSSEIVRNKILSISNPPMGRWFHPGVSGAPIFNSLGEIGGILTGAEILYGTERIPSGQIISHAVPTRRILSALG